MVSKDELYAEILRQNIEIRELKEHLAIMYVDYENEKSKPKWRLEDNFNQRAYAFGKPIDSQKY